MMREILFRAWHPESKLMIEFNGDSFKDQFIAHHFGLLVNNEHPEGIDLLMQYTGLTDKNGVKIFEGDIVKLKSIDHEKGGWVSNRACKGRVEFNDVWGVRFICKDLTQRTSDSHWGINLTSRECCNIQVIGNIHQNHELLK